MGNLHLVTGYQGTEHVTAADHGSLYAAIFGSGSYVLDRGNKLAATVVTNNQIRIADGDIILQGRHIRLNEGATVDLTIENGAQGYYRNDLICVRYTRNSGTGVEEASLVVIKGTAMTASPTDPEYNNGNLLTDNAETADFPLYRVPLDGITVQPLVALFKIIPAYGECGLDYVPNDEKGKANGVATLNSSGKVPTSQLPSMNYIPTSQKGIANGVATLGSNGRVPDSQSPMVLTEYDLIEQIGASGAKYGIKAYKYGRIVFVNITISSGNYPNRDDFVISGLPTPVQVPGYSNSFNFCCPLIGLLNTSGNAGCCGYVNVYYNSNGLRVYVLTGSDYQTTYGSKATIIYIADE